MIRTASKELATLLAIAYFVGVVLMWAQWIGG